MSRVKFLRSQAAVACDFATVDTAGLRRYYLLFFIDITNREVLYGGITTNPTGAWTTQAARNLFVRHPNRFSLVSGGREPPLYLVERLWRGSVGAGCSPRRVGLYPPVT